MNSEIVKYVICGGLAFLIDIVILYLCTEFLGMHYLVSNLLGYSAGLLFTYALNTRWVFDYRRYKKTWLEFLLFNLIVVTGLAFNEGLMALLVGTWGLYYLYAKVVTSFFVMMFNYIAKKFILFTPNQASRQN